MRTMVRTACLLAVLAPPAHASDERLLVDVVVNGLPRGEAIVMASTDGWWMSQEGWRSAGLPDAGGRRELQGTIEAVLLESVPGITEVDVDRVAQVVRLRLAPESLPRTTLDLGERPPLGTRDIRSTSAFLNYAVQGTGSGLGQVVTESGLSIRGALLTATATWNGRQLLRGPTQLVLDQRRRLTRWTFGDTVVFSGPVGSATGIVGLDVAREFSIDPYFNRYSSTSFAGVTATPSSIEVYDNGRLVRREAVQAGPFAIVNAPHEPGVGTTRVVVRDAFGAEQVLTSQFYQAVSTLPKGLQEFRYAAGPRRTTDASGRPGYTRPVFVAVHRWGVARALTLGFSAEGQAGLVSAGPTAALQLPVGEFEMALRASRWDGTTAVARSGAYTYRRGRFSMGARARMADWAYVTLDVDRRPDRIRAEATGYMSVPLGSRRTLLWQHSWYDTWTTRPASRIAGTYSHPIARRGVLSLNVSRQTGDTRQGLESSIGLTWLLGHRSTAAVTRSRSDRSLTGRDREVVTATLQQSLPTTNGWAYQVQAQEERGFARLEYQSRVGRYAVTTDVSSGTSRTTVAAAGAVAFIGGGAHFTRPIRDAFGLVDLGGLEGVGVLVANAPIGVTRGGGRLLIPNLLSYYANPVSLDDGGVPVDWDIPERQALVAPPLRGGAVIRLSAQSVRAVAGTVRLVPSDDAPPVAFATFVVDLGTRRLESPLDAAGRFYLEGLKAGSYSARVLSDTLTADCRFEVPDSRTPVTYLDEVVCTLAR